MTPKLKPHIILAANGNPLLKQILDLINNSTEINTLWEITNVNAVTRLGMTDHGIEHFQIVVSNAVAIQRLLAKKGGLTMHICRNYKLGADYGEAVVVLAALLHDIGMSIQRVSHEEYSLFLTNNLLHELLSFLPTRERTILISETLHAIISHRSDGKPLTLEAGIVRVADALDMTKGRSRLPYNPHQLNIHTVSAQAIDEILINPGRKTPIQIDIIMNHTAGLFQVDELLKKKIIGSGLEPYLEVKIFIEKDDKRQLFKDFYVK